MKWPPQAVEQPASSVMNFNQEINRSHKGQRIESNNIVQSNDRKNRHSIADTEWGDYVDKKIHVEETIKRENWQDNLEA